MSLNLARLALLAKTQPMPVSALPEVVPGRTVHVDGDMLAYFCAGGDGMSKDASRRALINRVTNFKELTGSEHAVVHITSRGSTKGHRTWVSMFAPKTYQGQRKGQRPANWEFLRVLMEEHGGARTGYPCIAWPDREADDAMALNAKGDLSVIATRDKDLRMVTNCWHITWMEYEMLWVPKGTWLIHDAQGREYGLYWFWYQMLAGDTVDNISGLPSYAGKAVGEATAKNLLSGVTNSEQAFNLVSGLYMAHYKEDWALQFVAQASMLWMRKGTGITVFYEELLPYTPSLAVLGGTIQWLNEEFDKA